MDAARALIAFACVPLVGAWLAASPACAGAAAAAGRAAAASNKTTPVTRVDVNSASRAQLKTLPGIGDVEADRIISGRPYYSKADLATREVIATGVYLSLRDRIIAVQRAATPKVVVR